MSDGLMVSEVAFKIHIFFGLPRCINKCICNMYACRIPTSSLDPGNLDEASEMEMKMKWTKTATPRKSKDLALPIGSRESFTWIIPRTILCLVLDFQGIYTLKFSCILWRVLGFLWQYQGWIQGVQKLLGSIFLTLETLEMQAFLATNSYENDGLWGTPRVCTC